MSKMTADERHLLLWKAGRTFIAPPHWVVSACQEKGLLTEGDLLSSSITDLGRASLANGDEGK